MAGLTGEGMFRQEGVTFGSISLAAVMYARELSEQSEEQYRPDVFANSVLSSMFTEPPMTPENIDSLPPDTLSAVVDFAVDHIQMRNQFSQTSPDLPVRERFYKAYLEWEQELFKGLSVTVGQILEPFTRGLAGSLARLAQPSQELSQALVNEVLEGIGKLGEITRQFFLDLAPTILAAVQATSQVLGVFDSLTQLIDAQKDATKAFNEAGWPIAPSMPSELRERVVCMHKQGKTRYVSRTIMGYYERHNHEHLAETVESWDSHSLFAPRMRVLRDALKAHCRGEYTLSVPALTSQIEGILSDYVIANDLVAKVGSPSQVYKAAIGDPGFHSLRTWVLAATLRYQLENNMYDYTDFEAELRKSAHTRVVTRHTVFHGIAFNYDRPIHSLRCFLLLDAVSALSRLPRSA